MLGKLPYVEIQASRTFYDDYVEMRQDGTKTGMSGQKANGYAILKGRPRKGNYLVRGDDVVHCLYRRTFVKRKDRPNPR